jgi:hypothetical protein
VSVWRKAAHLNLTAVTCSTVSAFWFAWTKKMSAFFAETDTLRLHRRAFTVSDVLDATSLLLPNNFGRRVEVVSNKFVKNAQMGRIKC